MRSYQMLDLMSVVCMPYCRMEKRSQTPEGHGSIGVGFHVSALTHLQVTLVRAQRKTGCSSGPASEKFRAFDTGMLWTRMK